MGGKSSASTSSASTSTTNNVDRRNAVQDGVGVSGDGNTTVYEVNSPDAVKAIAQAGADIIRDAGGAVLDLGKAQINANVETWDTTLTTGAALVDKLIDKVGDGFDLGQAAIDSFKPTDNAKQDTIQVGLIAAAVAGAFLLLSKK